MIRFSCMGPQATPLDLKVKTARCDEKFMRVSQEVGHFIKKDTCSSLYKVSLYGVHGKLLLLCRLRYF